jgi:hypothetical protein
MDQQISPWDLRFLLPNQIVSYGEPWPAPGKSDYAEVEIRMTVEDAIKVTRAKMLKHSPPDRFSDQQMFDEFMTVHWAHIVEIPV